MEKTNIIMKIESYSNGMLLLSVSDYGIQSRIKSLVELCDKKHGSFIKLEMSPPYKKRSLNENSKWWSMCTEFGNYCGMTKDDVAMGVKYRAMEEGLWQGENMPFSKSGTKRPVSTTKANTVEMATLIDVLYRIAAEDGYLFNE